MSDDFRDPAAAHLRRDSGLDWDNDPSVILKEQPRTACYWSIDGRFIVCQNAYPDDDVRIAFIPSVLPLLLKSIEEAIADASQTDKPAPSQGKLSSAERQKRYRQRHARNGGDVTREGQSDAPRNGADRNADEGLFADGDGK